LIRWSIIGKAPVALPYPLTKPVPYAVSEDYRLKSKPIPNS
jgi:hypothetical protein